MANPNQRKRPNVTRLIGSNKILIMGLITIVVSVNTIPAKSTEYVPSAKTIPEMTNETKYNETVLIIKCLRIVFTIISISRIDRYLQISTE